MRFARRVMVLGVMAAGSLGLSLLAFGTHDTALSAPALSAATNGPDLTALPVGDGRSTTSGPGRGSLYVCRTAPGGAPTANAPWIHGSTYDLTAKTTVDGAVSWANASFRKRVTRALVKLSGNGLPTNHTTGTFPIAPSDDAYAVDRNPNTISAQSVALRLSAHPTRLKRPQCTTGEVGIARNGVAIFNAVDAAGQDAVAHEVQDACSGHPQQSGVYHYHGLPACISSGTGKRHSKLIGWAYDGFPIYGPLGQKGVYMRTSDLDACHGHTHELKYQGERQRLFHYHATDEFPYTIGCFRGDPVSTGAP